LLPPVHDLVAEAPPLGILDRQLAFQSESVAKKCVLTWQHFGGMLRKDRGIAAARAG